MPDNFEYANNGGRKYLFHNLGNGKFEEVSAKAGHQQPALGAGGCAADLRGSGHPDLFIANDYGVSELYFNDGKRFHEVGRADGRGLRAKERDERRIWRYSQPGPLCGVRFQHFGERHSDPGKQLVGAEGRNDGRGHPISKIWRAISGWNSGDGVSARSSAI